jgi:nucleotide-binding universal stress UspA family protein
MFEQILVALDSSEQSSLVVNWVLQFQLASEINIILCHVIPLAESNLEKPADLPSADLSVGQFCSVERTLQTYQAMLPCRSELEIVTGDPAEEIIRLANIHAVDLIVLGSRGLTGVNRILKGSVSSQVVGEAPCTVLVVKQN